YFTHYLKNYGNSLPPHHSSEGVYESISLSKGASAEVNVQELFTNKSGALLTYEINNQSISVDWEQIEAGRFKLLFPNSGGYETYVLEIVAIDSNNNRSPAIKVTVWMNDNLADTDKDGVLDIHELDIDNDGVLNDWDRFPKDPTEWADRDYDGVGDNIDTDRDNDSVANSEDYFPDDGNCHKAEHGDSYGCYLTLSSYAFNDGNSTMYFLQAINIGEAEGRVRFVRFDINTNTFLVSSPILDIGGGYIYNKSYNVAHNSILMHDSSSNQLTMIRLDDFSSIQIRDATDVYTYAVFAENDYFAVYVGEHFTTRSWYEIYNSNGQLVDSNEPENQNEYAAFGIQKSESIDLCKYSLSLDDNGKLIEKGDKADWYNSICDGISSTSSNLLYTFFEQLDSGMRNVYDKSGVTVATINGYQLQWLENALVYLDFDKVQSVSSFDLVINDFVAGQIKRYSNVNNQLGDIYIVDKKIISFSAGTYNTPVRLMVFDKELNLEFNSVAP
ncbi:MAG: hypothetical protein EOO68_10670, partial [Moraxellaceae bacterium]